MFSHSGSDQKLASFSELPTTNKHLSSRALQATYGGNKHEQDKVQVHREPHNSSGVGRRVRLRLFVKGTEKPTAWSPRLPVSSRFPNTRCNPARAVPRGLYGSCCYRRRCTLHGLAAKVLRHSFPMSPNDAFPDCAGVAPLRPRLKKPLLTSPLPSSKHTCAHPPSRPPATQALLSTHYSCASFSSPSTAMLLFIFTYF